MPIPADENVTREPPGQASLNGTPQALVLKTVVESVTERLREAILSGELAEGEPLRQQMLARQYGVSLSVVREAIHKIETEGLAEAEPRRGARVSRLSADEIAELYEMRILLEGLLAHHAANAIGADDLGRAEGLLRTMDEERDPVRWLELNQHFHRVLYEPSGYMRILKVAADSRGTVERYLRVTLGLLHAFNIAQSEHRAILDAFRRRDPELAARQVEVHLRGTRDRILSFIASRQQVHEASDRE